VKTQALVRESTIDTSASDAILAQMTLAGDQRAFEVLLQRYSTPLFNFMYRFLGDYDQACDVLQQVSLRFYTSLPKLNTSEPFKAWLFQVARNCCVDEVRRRKRYAIYFSQLETENSDGEIVYLADRPDPGPLPEEMAEHHDLQQLLQRAILSLPPRFRAVVTLRYISQLSFSEIGKILSMPEATAKTYFHRAKMVLRKTLSAELKAVSA